MERHMRRVSLILLLLLAIGGVVSWIIRSNEACIDCRGWHSIASLQSETLQLQSSQGILNQGAIPASYDAAFYVSSDAIKELSDAFKSVEARIRGTNTTIKLTDLDLSFAPTGIRAVASLTATEEATGARVNLGVDGYLDYARTVVADKTKESSAQFLFRPTKVFAAAKWWIFTKRSNEFAEQLLATGAGRIFMKQLTVEMPTVAHLPVKLGFEQPEVDERKLGKATIRLQKKWLPSDVGPTIATMLPLFTNSGVWLVGRLQETSFKHPDVADLPKGRAEILQLREQLLTSVSTELDRVQIPKADIYAWLAKEVFLGIPSRLNKLDLPQRTLELQSTAVQGSIYNSLKRTKTGKWGASVNLASPTSASGHVRVENATSTWTAGSGLALKAVASAHAEMRIDVLLDPLISGGIDFDMNWRGDVPSTPINARLHLFEFLTPHGKSLAVGTESDCSEIEITALSGGEVEFGATLYENLEIQNASFAVDSIPRLQELTSIVDGAEKIVAFSPNSIRRHVQLLKLITSPDGYEISFKTDFGSSDEEDLDDSKRNLAKHKAEQLLDEHWEKSFPSKCGPNRSPKFLFAGDDFGENNLLVKALVDFLSLLGRGFDEAERQKELQKHNLKVAEQDLKDINDPLKAPEVTARIVGRSLRAAGKTAQQVDSAVSKAHSQAKTNWNHLEADAKGVVGRVKDEVERRTGIKLP
jgi:hypothetical protein